MWGAQVCSLSAMSGNYCLQKDSLYAIEAVRSITKIPINKPMQVFGAVINFQYCYGVLFLGTLNAAIASLLVGG
jgi:hypothetical protein